MSDVGIGSALREARLEQGRELSEAAAATSLRSGQLEALEDDRWEQFGGDVYAKGFIKNYATWLGMDPDPLLERYRRYVQHDAMDPLALTAGPVTGEPGSDIPAWLLRFGAALVVVALGVALVNLVQSRTPAPAEQEVPTEAAPDPADTGTQGAGGTPAATGTASSSPTPAPSPTDIDLTLGFENRSFVQVTVDGQDRQEGLFEAGETLTVQGEDEVTIRLGNAGGVTGVLNGERIGPFGASGEVLDLRFTPDGVEDQ